MDLIRALEQLSLEIKSQSSSANISNGSKISASALDEPTVPIEQQLAIPDLQETKWQYPSNYLMDLDGSSSLNHQLRDLDSSIETLFAQISEFDCRSVYSLAPNNPKAGASFRRAQFGSNSMETSQEEDSDCSSQQSCHASNRDHVNPLVRDLLKKDLNAITDAVRKMSKILSLGNQIEKLYKELDEDQRISIQYKSGPLFNFETSDQAKLSHLIAMCETFMILCSGEVHIENLPMINHYRDCINKLSEQLLTNPYCKLNLTEEFSDSNHSFASADRHHFDGADDYMDDDDDCDADIAFLNCDQRQPDNWTNNKLYMDNQ